MPTPRCPPWNHPRARTAAPRPRRQAPRAARPRSYITSRPASGATLPRTPLDRRVGVQRRPQPRALERPRATRRGTGTGAQSPRHESVGDRTAATRRHRRRAARSCPPCRAATPGTRPLHGSAARPSQPTCRSPRRGAHPRAVFASMAHRVASTAESAAHATRTPSPRIKERWAGVAKSVPLTHVSRRPYARLAPARHLPLVQIHEPGDARASARAILRALGLLVVLVDAARGRRARSACTVNRGRQAAPCICAAEARRARPLLYPLSRDAARRCRGRRRSPAARSQEDQRFVPPLELRAASARNTSQHPTAVPQRGNHVARQEASTTATLPPAGTAGHGTG